MFYNESMFFISTNFEFSLELLFKFTTHSKFNLPVTSSLPSVRMFGDIGPCKWTVLTMKTKHLPYNAA